MYFKSQIQGFLSNKSFIMMNVTTRKGDASLTEGRGDIHAAYYMEPEFHFAGLKVTKEKDWACSFVDRVLA